MLSDTRITDRLLRLLGPLHRRTAGRSSAEWGVIASIIVLCLLTLLLIFRHHVYQLITGSPVPPPYKPF